MEERAEGFEKIATTDHTQQLPPGTAMGMAMRRRPRLGMMRGGGAEGACGRRPLACAQASQGGLRVRPAKGFGSRLRLRRGGVG
jgi:hypothetical protein